MMIFSVLNGDPRRLLTKSKKTGCLFEGDRPARIIRSMHEGKSYFKLSRTYANASHLTEISHTPMPTPQNRSQQRVRLWST